MKVNSTYQKTYVLQLPAMYQDFFTMSTHMMSWATLLLLPRLFFGIKPIVNFGTHVNL